MNFEKRKSYSMWYCVISEEQIRLVLRFSLYWYITGSGELCPHLFFIAVIAVISWQQYLITLMWIVRDSVCMGHRWRKFKNQIMYLRLNRRMQRTLVIQSITYTWCTFMAITSYDRKKSFLLSLHQSELNAWIINRKSIHRHLLLILF